MRWLVVVLCLGVLAGCTPDAGFRAIVKEGEIVDTSWAEAHKMGVALVADMKVNSRQMNFVLYRMNLLVGAIQAYKARLILEEKPEQVAAFDAIFVATIDSMTQEQQQMETQNALDDIKYTEMLAKWDVWNENFRQARRLRATLATVLGVPAVLMSN